MSTETVQSIIITAGPAAVLPVWSCWCARVSRALRRVGTDHSAWAGGDRRDTTSIARNGQGRKLESRGGRIDHSEFRQ